MLNGNAAAECFDSLNISIGNRFAMVEKPMQTVQRGIPVDSFENVEKSGDRLLVGRVQAEGPTVFG